MWRLVEKEAVGSFLGLLEIYLSPSAAWGLGVGVGAGAGGSILALLLRMRSCHKCVLVNLDQEPPHGPTEASGMDKMRPLLGTRNRKVFVFRLIILRAGANPFFLLNNDPPLQPLIFFVSKK